MQEKFGFVMYAYKTLDKTNIYGTDNDTDFHNFSWTNDKLIMLSREIEPSKLQRLQNWD